MIYEHTVYRKGTSAFVTFELWEQTEYIVDFGEGWTEHYEQQVLRDYRAILQPLRGSLYQLNYDNFVGFTRFCGRTYEVRSRKLTGDDIGRMNRLISMKLATLPYQPHTPVQTSWVENAQVEAHRLHQWYCLRTALLEVWEGAPLQEWWQRMNRDPHHRLVSSTIRRPVWASNSVGPETVVGIVTNPEIWIELQDHHALAHSAVTQALSVWGKRYFPMEVKGQETKISFDTPENRMMKRIVLEMCELTDWMEGRLHSGRLYNQTELENMNKQMMECLNELLASSWLQDTGDAAQGRLPPMVFLLPAITIGRKLSAASRGNSCFGRYEGAFPNLRILVLFYGCGNSTGANGGLTNIIGENDGERSSRSACKWVVRYLRFPDGGSLGLL
jgi:hypothetical protein